MTIACPTCGNDLPAGTRFCPRDGTTVSTDTIALTTSAILAIGPAPPPTPDAPKPDEPKPDEPKRVAATDSVLGCVVDGRYRICAMLGKGAVGAVYQAEHVELHKRVALKLLHAAMAQTEQFRKRFEREARSASRLSHPACVSVIDFGHVSRIEPSQSGDQLLGMPYLVMELVKGELLADRIDKGRLSPHEAVVIARGVLAALRHAHGLAIVHRDIKPANISLASVGETAPLVKLLDFGLAKSVAADSPDAQQPLTQLGTIFGTPAYLSPEQASGKPADARSDLYALGVVLFEMICGAPPFVHVSPLDVLTDHVLKPPPTPRKFVPTLSTELEAVMRKSLAKEPGARFQTAEEFQVALAACPEASMAATTTQPAPPPSAPSATAPAARFALDRQRVLELMYRHRRILLVAAGATALLVLCGLLVARLLSPGASPAQAPPHVVVVTTPAAEPVSASARRHLELAQDYQQRLWCADAVSELERALRDEPELRASAELTRTAIPCLRARTQARAIQFLVEQVGPDAEPELQDALGRELKPDVREGVQRVLARLASRR